MSELPSVPSELIRLALADLAKVEADPQYRVHMGVWHTPVWPVTGEPATTCDVCLAGAVMAMSLGTAIQEMSNPEYFDHETESKLLALDSFRCGGVADGLREMGRAVPTGLPHVTHVVPYNQDPGRFTSMVHAMADLLEEHGL